MLVLMVLFTVGGLWVLSPEADAVLAHGGIPGLIAETGASSSPSACSATSSAARRRRSASARASDAWTASYRRRLTRTNDRTGPAASANEPRTTATTYVTPNRPAVRKEPHRMRKHWAFILLAVAGAALARALRRPPRPRLEQRVEPPGGAADLGGSDGGQHRPLRVPQPGQAEHAHHRLQLDPRRGSRGRAELLHVLPDRASTTSTSTATATGKPDITYSFRFKTPTGPYFLGNTQQTWTATRNGKAFATGKTPIDNIGPRFNGFVGVKDYEAAAETTIVTKRRRLDLRRPA